MRANINIDATTTTKSFAQQIATLYVGQRFQVGQGPQKREILSLGSVEIVTGLAFGEKPYSIGFISRQGEGAHIHSFGLVLVQIPPPAYGFIEQAYQALRDGLGEFRGERTYDITPQGVWWQDAT